jgi:hypothetical protein
VCKPRFRLIFQDKQTPPNKPPPYQSNPLPANSRAASIPCQDLYPRTSFGSVRCQGRCQHPAATCGSEKPAFEGYPGCAGGVLAAAYGPQRLDPPTTEGKMWAEAER